MEEEKQEVEWCENIINKLEEEIKSINEIGVENIEYLSELVDIHKDLSNEKYWKEKIYMYRDNYNNYDDYRDGSYGRIRRDSRGRYMDYYGRRGYDTKYSGEDMLDEMNNSYGAYSEGNEYGNYGHRDSVKDLEKMLDCNIALIEHLKKNAKSQEEIQVIDQKLQEMSRV